MLRDYQLSIKEAKAVPTVLGTSEEFQTLTHTVRSEEFQVLKNLRESVGRPRSVLFAQHTAIKELSLKKTGDSHVARALELQYYPMMYSALKPGFAKIG